MKTREKVLEILTQNAENPVSGEKLAEACGISRAAIWKAVKTLRDQGCNIEGTTNGGYVLHGTADIFSKDEVCRELCEFSQDFSSLHVETFSVIDSTNTHAKRILSECGNLRLPDGKLTEAGQKYHKSVYIAESQTAGRGRLGRTFISPSKTGIYLTLIYAPEGGITNPARLTALTGVAICRVIKRLYDVEPSIKWINDIFVNHKKICGILTEGSTNFETGTIESAIIGIGINISDNPEVFPPDVATIAGSIKGADNSAKTVTRSKLAAQVAGEVLKILEEDTASVMKEYKALSFMIGQKVEVHPIIGDETSVYSATAIDIDDNAGLIVQVEDGSTKTLSSGEVSLHSANYGE